MSEVIIERVYGEFLAGIKTSIRGSRLRVGRAVNRELIPLYWRIGEVFVERQERDCWGKSVVERLAANLRLEFSRTDGFSMPNLWFLSQMFLEYRGETNLLQFVRKIKLQRELAVKTFRARKIETGIFRGVGNA